MHLVSPITRLTRTVAIGVLMMAAMAACAGRAIAEPAEAAAQYLSFGEDLFLSLSAGDGDTRLRLEDGDLLRGGWAAGVELNWQPAEGTSLSFRTGVEIPGRGTLRSQDPVSARRGFVTLRAQHVFSADAFRLIPSGTLLFATESSPADGEIAGARFADQTTNYGQLSAEIEGRYSYAISAADVELYATVAGEWDFLRSDATLGPREQPLTFGLPLDGRAAAGLRLRADTGITSGIELSNGLVGDDGSENTSLIATISIDF